MPVPISAVRLSLEGLQSSTKTATAYTAPIPSVGFAFDMGWERALFGVKAEYWKGLDIQVYDYDPKVDKPDRDLWRGHDITIFKLPRPPQTDPIRLHGVRELWNYFNARIGLATFDKEYVKSVIVDTMTLARRVRADAHLQGLQERPPRQGESMRTNLIEIEYGIVNDSIRDIYTVFESVGINLVALHHLVDEREDRPVTDQRTGAVSVQRLKTGKLVLEGLNKTYQYVDMAMRMEIETAKGQAHSKATFHEKSGYNPGLLGQSLQDITWNSLMSYVEMSLGGTVQFPKSRVPVEEAANG